MAKPKAKTALAYADHEIELVDYQSKLLNTTLIEAKCNCGWYLRGFTDEHAEAVGKKHTDEPDVCYPSVIFNL
jgi:hypothetical protein